MSTTKRNKEIYKVTLVGSVVNVVLLLVKFVAGIVGHSAAMVADAVHSLSDFVTDVIVLVFVRISGKPQDKSHDYGHGKYETLAMTLIGVSLLVVAVGILYSGAMKIHLWLGGGQLEAPGTIALWTALLSVVLKEGIYRYSMVKARQLQSQAVEANAWHHRSDALSSIGTAVGIGGAIFLGQRWTVLDPLASCVVGGFIVKVAVDLLRNGIGDLMEQSLPEAVEKEILELVASLPGLSEPHALRTRRIGNHYAIELHILMDGDITLRQAHDKASEVEDLLRQHYGAETHVAVHVEPLREKQGPPENRRERGQDRWERGQDRWERGQDRPLQDRDGANRGTSTATLKPFTLLLLFLLAVTGCGQREAPLSAEELRLQHCWWIDSTTIAVDSLMEREALGAPTAESWMLVDDSTGLLLSAKNADRRMFPASLTKMMTCLLALESGKLADSIVITDDVYVAKNSRVRAGDGYLAGHLLCEMMLQSDNDAAYALAKHLAGDTLAFCEMMNRKAAYLGMDSTHFANPNGMPNDSNYTTARDLLVLARYCMGDSSFAKIVGTPFMDIPLTDGRHLPCPNTNTMLETYPGCIGVKTGFTRQAGACLASAAMRDGNTLFLVLLNSKTLNTRFSESEALLDYGFRVMAAPATPK